MIFTQTELPGVYIVDMEWRKDARGSFARAWCAREFADHGLSIRIAQCNTSFNTVEGTLRGLHYQEEPHAEIKLIRCTRGAIYDVVIDLRRSSSTYGRWLGIKLSAANGRLLYVPEGLAHGYQTLVDETEVTYQVSEFYTPEAERGVRWNDPAFALDWPPALHLVISEKDRAWPDYPLESRR